MLHFLTDKKIIIGLAVFVLIFTIISLIIKPAAPTPKIISTIPPDGSKDIDFNQEITIRFDQSLDSTQLSLSSDPEANWKIKKTEANLVTFYSDKYLLINTPYSLELKYKNSSIYKFDFTTIDQQDDPLYIKEVNDEIARDYPLALKTPLERPGFSVVYSKPLTLEITLKNQGASKDEIINSVRDWVKENGLDPNSHSYTFSN